MSLARRTTDVFDNLLGRLFQLSEFLSHLACWLIDNAYGQCAPPETGSETG